MDFPLSPLAATQTVIWGALIVGLLLGAAAQASRFCVQGAISDWYLFGSQSRMLSWVLTVAVATLGTQLLIAAQFFDATQTLAWSERFRWLSHLVGGTLFGFGMVLASGCPQRNLVKAGAGNMKSIVMLLVAAIAAQMTLRGVFAEARVHGLDPWAVQWNHPQDLGSILAAWLPLSAASLRLCILALLLVAVGVWLWRRRTDLQMSQWLASLLIGLLVPTAWLLTGHVGYLPEHPETLEQAWVGTQSRRPEALTFVAPLAHSLDLLTLWSDANTTATFGVMLTLGVLVGSHVSARLRGEFRVESFNNPRDLRNHLIGGVLMGFGGVTAMGCSVGQGVTGLAMLSAGAVIAVTGIVVGALLALKSMVSQVERGVV